MDVAALALNIDSTSVVKATKDLDRFSAASDRARAAAGGGTTSNTAKMAADYARAAEKAGQYSSAAMRAAAANDNVAAASRVAAAANDNVAASSGRAAAASAQAATAVERHVSWLDRLIARLRGVKPASDAAAASVGKSAGAMAVNTGNVAAQFQDIGVTAAMGMNPLIIGLQQGTQLSAVFAQSGASMGAVLSAAFRQIASAQAIMTIGLVAGVAALLQMVNWTKLAQSALNGLADVLVAIAPYAVAAAIALALIYSPAIIGGFLTLISTVGKLAISLLALIPIPVLIVAGLVAIVAAAVHFRDDLTKMLGFDIVKAAKDGLNFIVGGFVGAFDAIQKTWRMLPAAIGDSVIQATNAVIRSVDAMVNKAVASVNGLISKLPFGLGDKLQIGFRADSGQLDNPYAGSSAAVGTIASQSMAAAQGIDYVGKAIAGVSALAAAGADKLREWAKALGAKDDKKKKGDGGKTDAEKLADILRNAQAEITVEENRLKAVGMSARAAAELEQRTKLLNQIEKAGIPITAAMTAEVDRLAKAYGDAKIAADTAVAIQAVSDSIEKQIGVVADEVAMIGLYGDALEKARTELTLLRATRESLPKGEVISIADATRISDEAGQLARDQQQQRQMQRAEDLRKSSEDAAYAMNLERGAIGLTGQAALEYAFIAERLNEAKRQGVDLAPEEVAAINAAGAAYAAQRYAIDKQAEALANAREVTKGFFADWINGVREGGNLFKTFADSVVNSLNRIIDKLLDKTLNGFLDSMFMGGGGILGRLFGGGGGSGLQAGINASMNALGGAYGTAQRFANGAAFSNSILNSPTLFKFANGGKLGVAGEAGPEAVMPLTRGPNGKLGVQAHGGGGRSAPVVNVSIQQDFHLTGTVSQRDVEAMSREAAHQGAELAVSTVRRNFASFAGEWDEHGAVV